MSPPLRLRGYCRNCEAELYGKDKTYYCSKRCAAIYRWKDPEYRAKWQAALKGRPSIRPGHRWTCAYCDGSFEPTSNRQRYCRECAPDDAVVRLIRLYGMNQTEWNRRLIEQGGKCAVCRLRVPTVVDHDHDTGVVGGLLCVLCNGGLAWLENAEWRAKAEAYLARARPRMWQGGDVVSGQAEELPQGTQTAKSSRVAG